MRGGNMITEEAFDDKTVEIKGYETLQARVDGYLTNNTHITNCNPLFSRTIKRDCASNKSGAYSRRAIEGKEIYDAIGSDSSIDDDKKLQLQQTVEKWKAKGEEKWQKSMADE